MFNQPHIWTYEITTFFYAIGFMILVAYTLLHRGHVSIDLFYRRLSLRKQAIVTVVTYLVFFFPFVLILTKVGIELATASWVTKEVTTTARLPIVMPAMKTIIPIAAMLLLLQGMSEFVRNLFFLVKGRDL